MKKFCLTYGNYDGDETIVVDDLDDVNQLYGAMQYVVETGYCLIDVNVL